MHGFTIPQLAAGAIAGASALALLAAQPAAATYDGNSGRIAFGAFDATNRRQADIWSARAGEDDLHRLTDAPGRDICPPTPPNGRILQRPHRRIRDLGDGRRRKPRTPGDQPRHRGDLPRLLPGREPPGLLGGARGSGNTDLWTVPSAGGAAMAFTHTPDWSPDGSQIAYTANDDSWLMDADGSDRANLTHSATVDFGATFRPDGQRIAFTGTGGSVPVGQRYVQTIRTDGSDRQVVRPTSGLLQSVPAWQPLGRGHRARPAPDVSGGVRRRLSAWKAIMVVDTKGRP